MTMVLVLIFFVGAVLGMLLKAIVLVPMTIFTTGLVITVGVAFGEQIGTIALAATGIAICLQIGFASGKLTRMFIAENRVQSRRNISDTLTPPDYRPPGARIDRI